MQPAGTMPPTPLTKQEMSDVPKRTTPKRASTPARTMADVARIANVSKITVSRALSDSPLVRDNTKEHIRKVAREHGYRFNRTARNLRLQRADSIALVIDWDAEPLFSEPYPIALLAAIAGALTSRGFDLLLCAEIVASEDWSAAIASKPVDGAIIFGEDRSGQNFEGIHRANFPAILCGAERTGVPYPTVGSDNVRGGELAAQRLWDVGRRDFLYLGDIERPESRRRWQGFEKAARELSVNSVRHHPASINHRSGHESMREFLAGQGPCIDGLFAHNDMVAMGAIRAIERFGLDVPNDVSVIGYDDIPMAAGFSPPLTTIAQDSRRAAEEIASRLIRLIDGESVESLKLPATLVVRESCAPGSSG